MSRISDILQEQEEQKLLERNLIDAVINGKRFRKYTDVGNLFRLMLIPNNEHEFKDITKANLVTSMLPDTIEDDEKTVKKLQTEFNKIKKVVKNNKKPTIAMKKAYFSLLFSLLVPMTGSASKNFKITSLTNNFAAKSESAETFQRRATVLIGRSLLKSENADLNTKDKQIIKGLVSGLEEIDSETNTNGIEAAISDEVTDSDIVPEEHQPTSKIDSKVNSETSDEELEEIISKTETAVTAVKNDMDNHEARAATIKDMLKSNTESSTFHMTNQNLEPQLEASINQKMDTLFETTKKSMGIETANFVCRFVNDSLVHLNSVKGFLNFNAESLSFKLIEEDDGFKISMAAGSPSNGDSELFFMDRTFFPGKSGNLIVQNEQLQIPESLQGSSINKDLFSSALDLYKAKGVEKVQLSANVDVGGYAWFRYGFVPQDMEQIDGIVAWIKGVLPMVYMSLQYDAEDVGEFILNKSHDKSKDLIAFSDLLKGGQTDLAKTVIDKMTKSVAAEFKSTYSSPAKFKSMQTDLALKNFKSIEYKGTKYTMSYKSLLSIQALKDSTGFAIVPMTGGVYLNWYGELDMNDLEDTYAYLNKA